MIVDKNLTVDLNRVQPLQTIKIHQGDTESVRLVLTLTKDNTGVDLSNITVKYDAVIGKVLAESDAVGSVDGSKVIIPVTKNMTAKSGILKVDVKLIEKTSIFFTQTLTLTVERSVIDGDIIIDSSSTTINQKFDELNLKLEGLTVTFYTKTEVNQKLNGKENFEYHQDATLEKCDEYTDPSTIYRLYIDGSYQTLICTSPTGCQYRFTRWGQVFYRIYDMSNSVWGEWKHTATQIPDSTIKGNMLEKGTIEYDSLADDYFRYFYGQSLDDIDNLDIGIYEGSVSSNWQTKYGVSGEYILLHGNTQVLYFPQNDMIFHRKRSYSGTWSSWSKFQFGTNESVDIDEKLCGETGTVGDNYAWYTSSEEGYSLTGNYTLIGNYCILHGTAPLINDWGVVYYSLPVDFTEPSSTIAMCDDRVHTIDMQKKNNISVIAIRQIGSNMQSGTISFTLLYKYKN